MKFRIDITTSAGVRYGDGPLLTAQNWENVTRVDRAGSFKFSMPANDPRAALLGKKRYAHCYVSINGTVTEIGVGIIDKVGLEIEHDKAMLTVSGDNLLRELTWQRVGALTIGTAGDPPTSSTTGPSDIIALAPSGWSLDVVNGHAGTLTAVFHEFDGDTVLAALGKLAELTGEHFRLGAGRTIVWMQTDQDVCDVVAIRKPPAAEISPETNIAWITRFSEQDDSYQQFSRIYPYGAGEGAARIILDASVTWTPPDSDYEINTTGGYIRRKSVDNDLRIDGDQAFKDITDVDSLASASYQFLRTHSSIYNSYSLDLVELNQAVYPGSLIRTIYRKVVDGYAAVDIDANLDVLETTTTLDAKGLRTSKITASTIDRFAVDSVHMVIEGLRQASIFGKNKQFLNAPDVVGTPPGGQPLNAKLTAISSLANALGYLHNNGAGVFAYSVAEAGVSAALATRTAGGTYGSTEQTMLQEAHDAARTLLAALRNLGWIT